MTWYELAIGVGVLACICLWLIKFFFSLLRDEVCEYKAQQDRHFTFLIQTTHRVTKLEERLGEKEE